MTGQQIPTHQLDQLVAQARVDGVTPICADFAAGLFMGMRNEITREARATGRTLIPVAALLDFLDDAIIRQAELKAALIEAGL